MELLSFERALQVARSFDRNRNGFINRRWEMLFDRDSRHWLDENLDKKISIEELARGLHKGDVFIRNNPGNLCSVHLNGTIGQPRTGIPAVDTSVKLDLKVRSK